MKKIFPFPHTVWKADNGNGITLTKSVANWYFSCSQKCKRNVKVATSHFILFGFLKAKIRSWMATTKTSAICRNAWGNFKYMSWDWTCFIEEIFLIMRQFNRCRFNIYILIEIYWILILNFPHWFRPIYTHLSGPFSTIVTASWCH